MLKFMCILVPMHLHPLFLSLPPGQWKGPEGVFQVKMRGLPFSSGNKDIEDFIHPVHATSIEVIYDIHNRHSGEAMVTLDSQHSMDEVMKKDKQYMGMSVCVCVCAVGCGCARTCVCVWVCGCAIGCGWVCRCASALYYWSQLLLA